MAKPTCWMLFIISVSPKVIFRDPMLPALSKEKVVSGLKGIFFCRKKRKRQSAFSGKQAKKSFWSIDQPYEKFSQHIGRYPCVVIAPDDASLITGGSEERRKFLDAMLSQLDAELPATPDYLHQSIAATKFFTESICRNRRTEILLCWMCWISNW